MSGTTDAEVLAGGPDDGDEPPLPVIGRPRPPWLGPAAFGALGVLVGALGAHLLAAPQPTAGARPAASASASATSDAGPGVVVPEVVDAQTLLGSGGMEVVAESVPGASTPGTLRYDYRLVGAVWLAPDGTVRTGPPGCFLAEGEPEQVQYLQVAVVHARAVDGGPNADRVVWY
ncbi:MAG: hypothetical protein ACHQE5_02620, partial [Actinomycetes bacterium]